MIEVLSKPAHQIGISDIESLIASNVPERRTDRVQGKPVNGERHCRSVDGR